MGDGYELQNGVKEPTLDARLTLRCRGGISLCWAFCCLQRHERTVMRDSWRGVIYISKSIRDFWSVWHTSDNESGRISGQYMKPAGYMYSRNGSCFG